MTQGRVIFQGELGEIQLPDLLTFTDMLGKTGTLEVTASGSTRRIHLEKGEIIYADSTATSERMPEYLCRNGWITPEALAAARTPGHGDDVVVKLLVRDGALRPSFLPKAEKALVLDIVYGAFEWKQGTFRFMLTDHPHAEKIALKSSVSNVIVEGCRRLDEWQRIRERLPSDDAYPVPARGGAAASVNLPPLEQEILGQVDGARSIATIVQRVPHDLFTVLAALLQLLNAGLIGVQAQPARPVAAAAAGGNGGMAADDEQVAQDVVAAFNNIFAGLHSRIATVKGEQGRQRFLATLQKESFQRGGVFSGVQFAGDGTLPVAVVLKNVAQLPEAERLAKLKGSFDRLLAQQVVQMDTSYTNEDRKAIQDLIDREKRKIAGVAQV
jgi:hypothetical protein